VTDFQTIPGFEDVWRPPIRPRHIQTVPILSPRGTRPDVRSRLARIVSRAPEVMVKVTGRTRDGGHLRDHLDYISRNGELEMEDRDGGVIAGRSAVKELAQDWSAIAASDPRRRANTPVSLSLVLSMPALVDALTVRDAARAFARETFAERFDYAFALHTDTRHPHVHIAVRALGDDGERLRPKKADLEVWRQVFAQALRDRGVEAEATPRRARGITRKAERTPLRKMRERHQAGRGEPAKVQRAAYGEAAKAAFGGSAARLAWEERLLKRQARVRGLYLAQAQLLIRSPDAADRALGAEVAAFVRSMPQPDTRRLALARELRSANLALGHERSGGERERER
jgi:hypothetical protein